MGTAVRLAIPFHHRAVVDNLHAAMGASGVRHEPSPPRLTPCPPASCDPI